MSLRIHEDFGAAELNKAVTAIQIQSVGPVTLEAHNLGDNGVVVACSKLSDGSIIDTDRDTAVVDEDTTYNGDGSTLVFTGQVATNFPVLPGSVRFTDAGSVAPDLIDRDGDGILYTDDVDEDVAGTIDYFDGAQELSYPTGKAPGTGADAINMSYSYQDSLLNSKGKKSYHITNVLQEETVVVKVAANGVTGSQVKINGTSSWKQ